MPSRSVAAGATKRVLTVSGASADFIAVTVGSPAEDANPIAVTFVRWIVGRWLHGTWTAPGIERTRSM